MNLEGKAPSTRVQKIIAILCFLFAIGLFYAGFRSEASADTAIPPIQYEVSISGLPERMKVIEFYDKKGHHCVVTIIPSPQTFHSTSCEH